MNMQASLQCLRVSVEAHVRVRYKFHEGILNDIQVIHDTR